MVETMSVASDRWASIFFNNGFIKAIPACQECGASGYIRQSTPEWKCSKGHPAVIIKPQTHFSVCPYCCGRAEVCRFCKGRRWLRL